MQLFNKKGQVEGGMGLAIGLVIVATALMIGISVYSSISTSIDRGSLTAAENASFGKVLTNTNAGFSLGSILPIVLAASAIIIALVSGFAFGMRKQQ